MYLSGYEFLAKVTCYRCTTSLHLRYLKASYLAIVAIIGLYAIKLEAKPKRRTFLKFVTMKSYLGVFLLFLVCLQASQVFGARIKRSPVPVAEEECMKPDFGDECNFDDPCGEIISPCGGKKCYPCSGCNSYTCDPLSDK